MNDPQGRIVDVLHDSDSTRAVVEVDAQAVCPRCAEGRGCGAGIFSGGTGTRRLEARIPPDFDVRPGDVVRISLAPENLLRAAMIAYGLPLAGAGAGAAAAYQLDLGDPGAAMLALAGLGGGLWLARARLRRKDCVARFSPAIVGRVGATGQHP